MREANPNIHANDIGHEKLAAVFEAHFHHIS